MVLSQKDSTPVVVVAKQHEVVLSSGGHVRLLVSSAKPIPHAFLQFRRLRRDRVVLAERLDIAYWNTVEPPPPPPPPLQPKKDDTASFYGVIEATVPAEVISCADDNATKSIEVGVYSTRNIEHGTPRSLCHILLLEGRLDASIVWPHIIQLHGKPSSILVALKKSAGLTPRIVDKVIASTTNVVQLVLLDADGTQLRKLRVAATARTEPPGGVGAVDDAAFYVDAAIAFVPTCSKVRVQLSIDNAEFIDCGDIETMPHFSVICSVPPVLDPDDASNFAVLCSSSSCLASTTPKRQRRRAWPLAFPKEWDLEVSTPEVARAVLPMVPSPPRGAEITLLESIFSPDDLSPHKKNKIRAIRLVVDDVRVYSTPPQSSFWAFELELTATCRGATCSIPLGPIVAASNNNNSEVHHHPPDEKNDDEGYTAAELLTTRDAEQVGGSLRLSNTERLLLDNARDGVEVTLVVKMDPSATRANAKTPSVRAVLATGRAWLDDDDDARDGRANVELAPAHALCGRGAMLRMRLFFEHQQEQLEEDARHDRRRKLAKHVNIYAFRACAVALSSPVSSAEFFSARLCALPQKRGATNSFVCPERYGIVSTRWKLNPHKPEEWYVHESVPDSSRVEYRAPVWVRGNAFKHACGAVIKASFLLENGDVLAQEAYLKDDSAIAFETPAVLEPQMATLSIVFEYGAATIQSNPLPFEFLAIPDLDAVSPRYLPRSTGGTITVHGGDFLSTDVLRAYVYAPRILCRDDDDDDDERSAYAQNALIVAASRNLPSNSTGSLGCASHKSQHLRKKSIAAAFAAAQSVRSSGGSRATAAAAASAAYATVIMDNKHGIEEIDTCVVDAIMSTGGTRTVASAAGQAVLAAMTLSSQKLSSRLSKPQQGRRRSVIHEEEGGAWSKEDQQPSAAAVLPARDVMCQHGNQFAFGVRMESLAVVGTDNASGKELRYLELPVNVLESKKVTFVLPPKLTVERAHVAFSKACGFNNAPVFDKTKSVEFFSVSSVWPPCGESNGGTVVRIAGINFAKVLDVAKPSLTALPPPKSAPAAGNLPLLTRSKINSSSHSLQTTPPPPRRMASLKSLVRFTSIKRSRVAAFAEPGPRRRHHHATTKNQQSLIEPAAPRTVVVVKSSTGGSTLPPSPQPPTTSRRMSATSATLSRGTLASNASVKSVAAAAANAAAAAAADKNNKMATANLQQQQQQQQQQKRRGDDDAKVLVSFRFASPTTGRVLQRSTVEGTLSRLSSAQVHQESAAGAMAFANLAGTLAQPNPDASHAGNVLPAHDVADCICATSYSSARVGVAAAEHAISAHHDDCVIICKAPPIPATLIAKASSFVANVEVSLSGGNGPFSADNARFEYVRPPTLKSILPAGQQIVPGQTVLTLVGQTLAASRTLCVHLTLLTPPDPGKSQYGQARVLDRFVVPYDVEEVSGDGEPAKVHVRLPFFCRRRFASRRPRCIKLAPRPGQVGGRASSSSWLGAPADDHSLNLWVHSQPIVDDLARCVARRRPTRSRDNDSNSVKTKGGRERPLQSVCRRQGFSSSSSSSSSRRRRLSQHRASVGGILPPASNHQRNTHLSQQHSGDEKSSSPRFGGGHKRGSSLRRATVLGSSDNNKDISSSSASNCFIQDIGIELSPNGQDWSDRASRKVRLASPYEVTRLEPARGPRGGGTKVTIHGANFPEETNNCLVAFLRPGVSPRRLSKPAMKMKGVSYDVLATTKHSPAALQHATRQIQRVVRGRTFRRLCKYGLPCTCVKATVESPTRITCYAPGVLTEGPAEVVISFDGRNFERAPTDELKALRIGDVLLEGTGLDAKRATVELERASSSSKARLITQQSYNQIFDGRLQLSYEYYVAPDIRAIREVQPPFTDAFDIVGARFKLGSEVMVRFCALDTAQTITVTGEAIEEDLITVVAPTQLANGAEVELSVSMNGGHDYTEALCYSVFKKPILESIRPSCGQISGGSLVEIHGENFLKLTSSNGVKTRFSLDLGDNNPATAHKLCVVPSDVESTSILRLTLPPFEKLINKAKDERVLLLDDDDDDFDEASPQQRREDDEEEEHAKHQQHLRRRRTNTISTVWVDVCTDCCGTCTGKPLRFLLYERVPKMNHMQPRAGPLSGGYKVRVFGVGFLNTNTLAVRLVPLPTAEDLGGGNVDEELTRGRRDREEEEEETSRKESTVEGRPTEIYENTVRPVGVRGTYVSSSEISFVMPWLHQQGQFLVQTSLNSSEFAEPDEQCLFTLYSDHRAHVRDLFPAIHGPEDVATSKNACRLWRELQASRHRPLATSPETMRNNDRARGYYESAADKPHVVRPSLRAILKAIAEEVDEKECVNLAGVADVAREREAPLQGLADHQVPSFDAHPALATRGSSAAATTMMMMTTTSVVSSRFSDSSTGGDVAAVPAWHTKTLVLKLQHLLREDGARGDLLKVLTLAFGHIIGKKKTAAEKQNRRNGLTYGELCEHLMLAIFPSSSQVDLLELWQVADPLKTGFVSLSTLVARLRGKRPTSPTPGPAHYRADPLILKRTTPTGREPMTLDVYEQRRALVIPRVATTTTTPTTT